MIACPSSRVLLNFLTDRLCSECHLRVLVHVAGCEECYRRCDEELSREVLRAEKAITTLDAPKASRYVVSEGECSEDEDNHNHQIER